MERYTATLHYTIQYEFSAENDEEAQVKLEDGSTAFGHEIRQVAGRAYSTAVITEDHSAAPVEGTTLGSVDDK